MNTKKSTSTHPVHQHTRFLSVLEMMKSLSSSPSSSKVIKATECLSGSLAPQCQSQGKKRANWQKRRWGWFENTTSVYKCTYTAWLQSPYSPDNEKLYAHTYHRKLPLPRPLFSAVWIKADEMNIWIMKGPQFYCTFSVTKPAATKVLRFSQLISCWKNPQPDNRWFLTLCLVNF